MSQKKESWLDAHFDCKDRNSKLAEPLKFADKRLRKYLRNNDQTNGDKWIGGMYNWQKKKWQWGYNGGEMKYQAFDDKIDRYARDKKLLFFNKFPFSNLICSENLQFHCTAMAPAVDYK
jgi:hypothetical protein